MASPPKTIAEYLHTSDKDLAKRLDNLWLVARQMHDRQGRADAHDNGRHHIEMVEHNAWRLLNTRHLETHQLQIDVCTPQELFILSAAICCHDFDKGLDSANPLPKDFRKHGVGSGAFVITNAKVLGLDDQHAEAVSAATSLHDRKATEFTAGLGAVDEDHLTPFGKVRLHLIVILLKASDVLQCDQSRVPSIAMDESQLQGQARAKFLTRKCTRGWNPDGSRIIIQAAPRNDEERAAVDASFAYMRDQEWAGVREGLRRFGFPFNVSLSVVSGGLVTRTNGPAPQATAPPGHPR